MISEGKLNMVKEIKKQFDGDVDTLSSLISAIETHNIVAFRYTKDVNASGIRKVLPHNLYWNKDNSNVMLDAFQIQGDSASANGIKSFKQFNCKHVKDCIILNDKFEIQKQYNATSDRYNNSILGIVD